jgi:protein-disulfide isomerase
MKYFIALAALFCVGLIGISVYIANQQDGGGPRLIPIHSAYTQRMADGAWVTGNRDSKIVVSEYADFQCPACRTMSTILNEVVAIDGKNIRFEYHEFPLTTIHNKSTLAAEGAEAAGRQGKFWEMHDLLYARQTDWENKLPSSFQSDMYDMAQTLGLNLEQFKRDLKDTSIQDPINADVQKATELNLTATPSIFVNGKAVETFPQDAKEMIDMIHKMAAE